MSDPGLYTHLYLQLSDCAELLDHVIIDLESKGSVTDHKRREALANLLRTLQTSPGSNFNAILLVNVLRSRRSPAQPNWTEIADAIVRGDASEPVMAQLEELARALESERADMHARIQGAHA